MKHIYDEFNDDIIYQDGHCDPMSGSNADFKYDEDEVLYYAEMLKFECVEVHMATK